MYQMIVSARTSDGFVVDFCHEIDGNSYVYVQGKNKEWCRLTSCSQIAVGLEIRGRYREPRWHCQNKWSQNEIKFQTTTVTEIIVRFQTVK